MSNEELTKIFIDKLEAVVVRGNETADALNKIIGKLEAKELSCFNHVASITRAHVRVDEMEKAVASIDKSLSTLTGAKMLIAWLATTAVALWGVLKDHVK